MEERRVARSSGGGEEEAGGWGAKQPRQEASVGCVSGSCRGEGFLSREGVSSTLLEVEVGIALVLGIESGDPAVEDVGGDDKQVGGMLLESELLGVVSGSGEGGKESEEILCDLASEGAPLVDSAPGKLEVGDAVGRLDRDADLDDGAARELLAPGRLEDARGLIGRDGADDAPGDAVHRIVEHRTRACAERRARQKEEHNLAGVPRVRHCRDQFCRPDRLELRDHGPARDH
mmetsp:Transcript_8688/g.27290  ORF Transcript_8688/g.27290 Transcript_8688/m.27290 type:complete len:232 (-) Transcript_8688:252-947(-)